MKVTGLKKSGKGNKIAVSVDGEYVASVSMDCLLELGIRTDRDLASDQLQELKKQASRENTVGDAAKLLQYGPKTEYELKKRLEAKGHSSSDINFAVDRCKALHLIDDAEYCHSFVRIHKEMNGWGPKKTEQALKAKGLSDTQISEAMDACFDQEAIIEAAITAGRKKLKILQKKTCEKKILQQKLIQFLRGRGFSYDTCLKVVDSLLYDTDE